MSDLLVEVVEHRRRPILHNSPEDLGRNRRLVAREHAPTADLMVVDRLDIAVAIPVDTLDGVRPAMDAATGESRVCRGHVERTDTRTQAAYRGRRVGVDGRGDAKVFGELDDVVQSNVVGELYEDRVVRLSHGVGHGDLSPFYIVVVVYLVVLVLEVEGQIVGDVGALRGNVLLEGSGEHDGLEGAAWLTSGVESEVEVSLLSRQGAYGAALGLYRHDGGRRVGRLEEYLIRGLDRRVLEVWIHRRVNSQSPEL